MFDVSCHLLKPANMFKHAKSHMHTPPASLLFLPRSPRSEAGGSVYSNGTYTTQRTARTATTYLSFQFSQMSRKTGISSSPLRISTSLAAGGAAEKAAVIFRKHDVNQVRLPDIMLQPIVGMQATCAALGSLLCAVSGQSWTACAERQSVECSLVAWCPCRTTT